jgi:ureidoacrylate peracid hydrolase
VANEELKRDWSNYVRHFSNDVLTERYVETFTEGSFGWQLWPSLDVQPADLRIAKTKFSPFVPGSSNLHAILRERGIDTLIITGTSTNICCESTARDAAQMNYTVIFVVDGTAAESDALHNATLANMITHFADLMTTDEVVLRLRAGCRRSGHAKENA